MIRKYIASWRPRALCERLSSRASAPLRAVLPKIAILALVSGCATMEPDLPPVPVGPPPAPVVHPPVAAPPPPRIVMPQSIAPPVRSAEEIARVQILLDRANFSPGPIDGRWGPQSRAALREWLRREGLPETGEVDDALLARAPPAEQSFASYMVTDADHAALRPFPRGWRERAALDQHGYETILETIAERHHASERFIRELNPNVAWPNPPAGAVVTVPRVRPYTRGSAARIEITLSEKILRVFDAEGRLIARFPCSIAKRVEKRPVGELKIVNAAENPNYTFDPALFSEDPAAAGIERRLLIPPGPNNPVGVAWLSLDRPGYGIHGTPFPEEIGKTESHGCFRLANWNARKLLEMISIGIPVFVKE